MVNHVYKVKYSKSSLELNNDYENLSDFEKESLSELDALSFFDFEEDQKYTCYIITTRLDLKKYIKILLNILIILSGKLDIENETRNKIDNFNFLKYEFFIDHINDWIYENLEIDIVLDRINEVGMDSLKDIEKLFLKQYSK